MGACRGSNRRRRCCTRDLCCRRRAREEARLGRAGERRRWERTRWGCAWKNTGEWKGGGGLIMWIICMRGQRRRQSSRRSCLACSRSGSMLKRRIVTRTRQSRRSLGRALLCLHCRRCASTALHCRTPGERGGGYQPARACSPCVFGVCAGASCGHETVTLPLQLDEHHSEARRFAAHAET